MDTSKIEMLTGGLCVTILPSDGAKHIEMEGFNNLKAAYRFMCDNASFEDDILLWKYKTDGEFQVMLPLAAGNRDDFAILGSL